MSSALPAKAEGEQMASLPFPLHLQRPEGNPDALRKRGRDPTGDPRLDPGAEIFPRPKRNAGPNDVLFRVVVPSKQIGRVIGREGSQIQQIRADTGATIKIADAVNASIRSNENIVPHQLVDYLDMVNITPKASDGETLEPTPRGFLVEGMDSLPSEVRHIVYEHEQSLQKALGRAIAKKLRECNGALDFFWIKGEVNSAIHVAHQLHVNTSHLQEMIEPLSVKALDLGSRNRELVDKEAALQLLERRLQEKIESSRAEFKGRIEMLQKDLKVSDAWMVDIMEEL